MKRKITGLLLALLLLMSFFVQPNKSYAEEISLTNLESYSNSSYFYVNSWSSSKSFEDINGKVIDKGIGLSTYYGSGGTSYASYNIEGLGYKSFHASISLDSKWITGDFGKSAIGFYANDVLLYEKQLSKTSGIVDVNFKLPEKATNFRVIVKQVKGAKGTQGVIVSNPVFSTNGTYLNQDELPITPSTVGAGSYSSYYYVNQWDSSSVFQDIKGNLVTDGLGLSTYYGSGGTSYASYNIDDMGFNRFETKISLDSKWVAGDFGRSAVGIYADDFLLYEKEITAKTPVQLITLNIPKGTKNVTIVAKQIKGARGTQGIVLINPLFKKTKDKVVEIPYTASVSTVGATDSSNYYYINDWNHEPFQYSNGQFATRGIALSSYYGSGGTSYATYDVKNMGFNALKTKISLDSKWLVGDYGKSTVFMYADSKLLYSTTLKKSDIKNLTLRFPSNTKNITISVKQTKGARGTQGVVFGNSVFTKLPVSQKLTSNQVSISNKKKKNDSITVKSINKGEYIKVYNSKGQTIASGKAAASSITFNIKQIGIKKGLVYVTRTSGGKLESDKTSVGFKAE